MSGKVLPTGTSKFWSIREKNMYYADKTRFIEQPIRKDEDIYLFTRPRRFGKSMNLNMVDLYFSTEYKGNNWFDGLYIDSADFSDLDNLSSKSVIRRKNSHPVIYLNFKDVFADFIKGQFYDSLVISLRILSE